MSFDKSVQVKPVKFGNIDATFDERGSSFLAIRRIQWCKEGESPDEEKSKLELRKWMVDKDGEEIPNKGFAFLTEDGPHELAKVLVREGFGKTGEILSELIKRNDFKDSVEHLGQDVDDTDGEYFDMRTLLSNIEVDEEDE